MTGLTIGFTTSFERYALLMAVVGLSLHPAVLIVTADVSAIAIVVLAARYFGLLRFW